MWAFAGDTGACESIPQDREGGSAHKSPRACATAYPTEVRQGMLFVWLNATPLAGGGVVPPLPTLKELDDPEYVVIDIARDLPYDYATLFENVLDVAHVPSVHHLTVSNRANAAPVDLEVLAPGVTAAGFDGLWQEGPRRGKLGSQHTHFIAPSLMYHSLSAPSLGTTLTVVYATPIAPGKVRLMARFPFRFNSWLPRLVISRAPRWVQHVGQNGVLEDDQIILHKQERDYALTTAGGKSFAQACYLPLASDAYTSAFREWLAKFAGGAPAWPAGMSPALPPAVEVREALLDRYNSHTRNCTSCMRALRGVRAARAAAVALGVVAALLASGSLAVAAMMAGSAGVRAPLAAAAAGPLTAAAAGLGTAVLSLLAWLRLSRLESLFLIGPYPPPRNRPVRAKLITRGPKNSGQSIKLV
jgi:phenylpropionate dioxygenase-like ring-hydroxylating dioxygenase large terminal subunit